MASQVRPRPAISAAHRSALDSARGVTSAPTEAPVSAKDAPIVVTLPPSAFAQSWAGKPNEPVRIGLRLCSESTHDKARANATVSADRFYPEASRNSESYVEHWNGQIVRGVMAEAVCQPHDVTRSWFKAMAADLVGVAFTEKGILRLWQGYAELTERLSPLLRLATPEDLSDLSTRLADADAIGHLHDGDRRLLARILDDLRAQG